VRLTSRQVWLSTLVFGALDLILLLPLLIVFRNDAFRGAAWPVGVASALFWGLVALVVVFRYWDLYYGYFYPGWIRWLTPLDVAFYGILGLGMWWLAQRLPGPMALSFVLLGGIEGIAEHLVGIYGLRILDRVPWLQGVAPLPVVVFSTFEYLFYWALVAWLALGLQQLSA
jgi:hypothetical protein